MSRSQRRHIFILLGFAAWLLIFVGQHLYFSSLHGQPYCWFPSCERAAPLTVAFRTNLVRNSSALDHSRAILRQQPLLDRYRSEHVNFPRLIKPSVVLTKYLIYTCNQPCGGWGDRTRKIVGAFLLALALNRTFLIDMTWPCSITNVLEPNFILWNRTIKHLDQRSNVTVHSLTATDNDYRQILQWEHIDVVHFHVKDLAYYSLLLWRDDLYQVLHVEYGLDRSILFIHSIFTLMYELLFRLKAHPRSHLDEIERRFSLQSMRCAHIRIGRNPSNPNDVIFPKREHMNTTVIGFLKNVSRANETIFVSTDSDEVQAYARKQFGTRLLTIDGIIRHIDRSGKKLACDGFEKTILDFYMISKCHTLVMSKSAFRFASLSAEIIDACSLFVFLFPRLVTIVSGPTCVDCNPMPISSSTVMVCNGSEVRAITIAIRTVSVSRMIACVCRYSLRNKRFFYTSLHGHREREHRDVV